MPLDEKSLRKPGFTEGARIRLADGQEWTFPELFVRFTPRRRADGRWEFGLGRRTLGDPGFQDAVDTFAETEDADERFDALLNLAVLMLGHNYELAPEDVAPLLTLDMAGDTSVGMWNAIADVITGDSSPKRSDAGSQ